VRAINHSSNSPEEVPFCDRGGDREAAGGKRMSCLSPVALFNQRPALFQPERELKSDHYARFLGLKDASLDRQNNFFSFKT